VSDDSAKVDQQRGRNPGGRLGRRVGITLFWLMLCYLVAMSSFSILPALFWPAHAPHPPALPTERCASEIDTLDRELLRNAALHLRGKQRVQLATWLAAWDQRYMALDGGCGVLEPARRDLGALRSGIESLLQNYELGPGKARQRIRHALEPMSSDVGSMLRRFFEADRHTHSNG
jgi:hypothetical protein